MCVFSWKFVDLLLLLALRHEKTNTIVLTYFLINLHHHVGGTVICHPNTSSVQVLINCRHAYNYELI